MKRFKAAVSLFNVSLSSPIRVFILQALEMPLEEQNRLAGKQGAFK